MAQRRSVQTKAKLLKTVRLSEEKINALLDRLDGQITSAIRQRRRQERFEYRPRAVIVHIQQPGSASSVAYAAPARNISAGGVSFLHGGFIHKGTVILVQLLTLHGRWENVAGEVVASRLAEGNIHEICVQFKHMIDVAAYTLNAVQARVLLVEDDPSHARLAMFHLANLRAEVDHVDNGDAALKLARHKNYDIVLLDMVMPELDGFEVVRQLRQDGYSGQVFAMTSLTQLEDEARCLAAGCDGYIAKPYTREDLVSALATLDEQPLFSTLASDPDMMEMVCQFVDGLPARLQKMEKAMAKADLTAVEALVRATKADGGSFGFARITEEAARVERTLQGDADTARITADVRGLIKLCRGVRRPIIAAAPDQKPPKRQTRNGQVPAGSRWTDDPG